MGGMLWAGITEPSCATGSTPAEMLVSLMLVYVADLFLGFLVYRSLERPGRVDDSQDHHVSRRDQNPRLLRDYAPTPGTVIALFAVGAF